MHSEDIDVYDEGDKVIILNGYYKGHKATVLHESIYSDDYWLKTDDGASIVLRDTEFELDEG